MALGPYDSEDRRKMLERYLNDTYLDTLLDMQADCLVDSASLACATVTALGIMASIVVPVTVAVGTFGNLVTVHIILRRMHHRTRLHLYLACIALSDWGNLLSWGVAWQILARGLPWITLGRLGIIIPNISDAMCRVFRFAHNFFHVLSANWFLLMTVDRLFALYRPLSARTLSLRSAFRAALAGLVVSLLIAAPVPAFWGWMRLPDERIACLAVPFYGEGVRLWTTVTSLMLMLPPTLQLMTVFLCNALLLIMLYRRAAGSSAFNWGGVGQRHGPHRLLTEELAPTLVVVALSMIFLVSGLPVCISGFIVLHRSIYPSNSATEVINLRSVYNVGDIGQILMLIHQSLNWAVLLWKDRHFRAHFLAVFRLSRTAPIFRWELQQYQRQQQIQNPVFNGNQQERER